MRQIIVRDFGPIREASVEPGDLTILVGPQASGKSVILQTIKAALDMDAIVEALKLHGYQWNRDERRFVELLFGDGMGGLVQSSTRLEIDGQPWLLGEHANRAHGKHGRQGMRVFYVPAQRVLTLQEGWPRPFTAFDIETPFVVKEFSEQLRRLLEEGESAPDSGQRLFPGRYWKHEIRDVVGGAIFHGSTVEVDTARLRKRIVLRPGGAGALPFLSWSAGQREFIPLMLGLYWLMPTQATSRRGKLQWAIIEEPEMGLHPAAIEAFGLLVLDLLARGYRVLVSTHSPLLLELAWALRHLKPAFAEQPGILARLFGLRAGAGLNDLARKLVDKQVKAYHFGHGEAGVVAKDISALDPASDDPDVAEWGGLTTFAERANDLVADQLSFSFGTDAA